MSGYNAKNYTEQGGDKTVIGGMLEFKEGSSISGLEGAAVLTAAGESLGGVKAAAKGAGDTVEAKIGPDDKLYVPTYPVLAAAGATLGGVKADAAGEGDTVEVKIGAGDKLYVPVYPAAVTPADNQANSVATTVEGLVTDFNALLLKLQTAGLMGGSME